jgi:DNA-binding MarR family transcriptional regulator
MNDAEFAMLTEIRDLLLLIAEPQIAQRDKSMRDELRKIAGKSMKNIKAISLMDGSRNQSVIAKEVPMDHGNLSKLVKTLDEAKLLRSSTNPTIAIPVSESMFREGL